MFKKRRFFINNPLFLFVLLFILGIIVTGYYFVDPTSEREAKEKVNEFYQLEQEGEFSESWELFHSLMQKKFPKGHYIQDRAHVFMNHFGVDTFSYEIGEVDKEENWKMDRESPSALSVFRVEVKQFYTGKYGNFSIDQEVFVTEENNEWKILWDYKK